MVAQYIKVAAWLLHGRLVSLVAAYAFALQGMLLCPSAASGETHAQTDYPTAPVRLISDSSPGSTVDVVLRLVADGMSQHWGQQVLVINHAGAAGAIAARNAAQAAPDGYTLFAPSTSLFLAVPGKAPNLPPMVPRDFVAIGYTVDQPLAIGVWPKLGIKTLPELIALAKQKPGQLSYAVTGVGRLTHMMGELLQIRTGIQLHMVPYSGGSTQAYTDVIAGRIPIVMEGYATMSGAVQSGAVTAIAIASPDRLPGIDVPTVGETLPGFVASGWQAVVAPLGTPQAIIDKAAAALRAALENREVRDKIAARVLCACANADRDRRLHPCATGTMEAGTGAGSAADGREMKEAALFEHDLFRKPVPTFRDHALIRLCP